jgi:hypothetical protein
MEFHWTVMSIPLVLLGAVAVFYALRRHKEKPPTDHVLKL